MLRATIASDNPGHTGRTVCVCVFVVIMLEELGVYAYVHKTCRQESSTSTPI